LWFELIPGTLCHPVLPSVVFRYDLRTRDHCARFRTWL